ncbi:MAG: NYN domain-containing protein [Dehalococcoidia bacterium]|nr:NYN domain-containing protein [Dehalococcoidia bacterium]
MTTDRDADGRARRTAEPITPRIVARRPAAVQPGLVRPVAPPASAEPPASEDEARPRTRRGTRGGRGRGTGAAVAASAATTNSAPAPAEVEDVAPVVAPRAPTVRRAAAPKVEATPAEVGSINETLRGVRTALEDLDRRMGRLERRQRLGVFVDVPNVIYGAERGEKMINMGRLLDLLSEGRDLVRATAYSPVSDDPGEPIERQKFVAPFVPHEYRIVTKPLKRFADGSIKGNFDVEMAVDMVTMAERLDVICIVSGDADFARVVEVLQGRGVRVEVVAFDNSTSAEMRAIADHYLELGSVIEKLR